MLDKDKSYFVIIFIFPPERLALRRTKFVVVIITEREGGEGRVVITTTRELLNLIDSPTVVPPWPAVLVSLTILINTRVSPDSTD